MQERTPIFSNLKLDLTLCRPSGYNLVREVGLGGCEQWGKMPDK